MKVAILCFIFVAAQASGLNEVRPDLKISSTADLPTIEEINKNLVTIDNNTYYIGSDPLLNWVESVRFCGSLGMTLVSLETQEKYELIYNYLKTESGLGYARYWTSGVVVGGNWIWSSRGTEITYFNWAAGDPTLIPQELCVFINVNTFNDNMHDAACNSPQHFVCEFAC